MIKQCLKMSNRDDKLPDFYNIMLERHINDPEGYNILFIDPIQFGNFASRLNHSCDANCATVATISEGKYVIALYAIKDIKYGEELTFDYCAQTESKEEFEKAICLCGSNQCRMHYLDFINHRFL